MSRRPRARRSRRAARPNGRSPLRRANARRAVAAFLLLAVLAAGTLYWGPGPSARDRAPREVILPLGGGVQSIATGLARAGVIRSSLTFIAAAELTGRSRALKAGEYAFASGTSLARVLDAIARGAVVRRLVTIPEGVTSKTALGIVERAPYLTGTAPVPPEGSLLPETYEIRRGERRAGVIARMRAARADLLARLWAGRARALPYRTPEDAVILASVIEKETAKPEERPRIAEVFVNRLRRGMRLESDPTVIYGLTGGEPLGHGLRLSELARGGPYNTYLAAGLPPTPIANPGRASLAAALNPAPGNALYFVADGSGGHVFAATFEEHLRNVARWRQVEQRRAKGAAG